MFICDLNMRIEKVILILACVSGAFTFTCPDDSHSFYHADVSTGCTVYHFCENSLLTTLACPAGEAFNHTTSQCEDASSVSCIETMVHHNMHHHQKRAIQENHVIPIKLVQIKAVELYHAMKPLIISTLQDITPSIYAEFKANYLPSINAIKSDVMPLFYAKVWPQIQKSVSYARLMAGRVIKKAYESYELSNSTHIIIVSCYDVINDIFNDIKPVIRLGKYMSARLIPQTRAKRSAMGSELHEVIFNLTESFADTHHSKHHHQKRAIQKYHVIPIKHVQIKAVKLYHAMKSLIISTLQDIAPSIYAEFKANYLPSINAIKSDVMPLFYAKVWPQIQKSVNYARRMTGRVIKKAYESYELSNSTHITLVSLSDIINDFSNDIKPVIRLGKYMSARLIQNTRAKRSAQDYGMPDFITSIIEPLVKNIFGSIGSIFVGQKNTITSKLILPIVFKMIEDPETRFDMLKVISSSKAAFTPVLWEMLSRQTFNTPDGTIIRIPRATVDVALNKFYAETKPIIHKILNKHLSMILTLASQHVPLIMESVDILKDVSRQHFGVLKDSILGFISKHGSLMQTSDSKYINTYTLTEIKKDLKPISMSFLQIGIEYLSKNKNSWLGMLFNRDSYISKSLVGSPVYAKPSYMIPSKSNIVIKNAVRRG